MLNVLSQKKEKKFNKFPGLVIIDLKYIYVCIYIYIYMCVCVCIVQPVDGFYNFSIITFG